MFSWIFGKSLEKELYATKPIKVNGVKFVIRKVNISNYLEGSKVLLQKFDTHKTSKQKESEPQVSQDKIKKHQADVLVAGVVEPKLVFKSSENGILVDDLFMNQEMVNGLYTAILEYTYGKKKVADMAQQLISREKSSSNSMP